jgi:hypothetical protein
MPSDLAASFCTQLLTASALISMLRVWYSKDPTFGPISQLAPRSILPFPNHVHTTFIASIQPTVHPPMFVLLILCENVLHVPIVDLPVY